MPLTGLQQRIVYRVGEIDAGASDPASLTANVAAIWDSYAGKAAQDLYTVRECIDLAIGAERKSVTFRTPNIAANESDRLSGLLKLRAEIQTEIERVEAIAVASGAPAIGPITATVPRTAQDAMDESPPAFPDGALPRYRGDLYSRTVAPW